MKDFIELFFLCFVPVFVAVDAVGILPMYMQLTEGYAPDARRRLLISSMATATGVAFLFTFTGPELLRLLGISVNDFSVAGGLILFVLALLDLMSEGKIRRSPGKLHAGAVPLGVPIIVGPAVLATLMLLVKQYGYTMTLIALLCNLVFAAIVFSLATPLTKFLGDAGSRIVSKIATLFLAAIGVMMVRKGITGMLGG